VKKLKPFQGKEWCVISYVDGKRKLKWFANEEDAKEYAPFKTGIVMIMAQKSNSPPNSVLL
jgi:hypothetical protein